MSHYASLDPLGDLVCERRLRYPAELFTNVVDQGIRSGSVFASDQVNSVDECGALEHEGTEVGSVDTAPLVTGCLSLTVAYADSIGLTVRR